MRRIATITAVAGAFALAPAAQAHVTLQPDEAPAGGFARLDVRVPNERDDTGTTKVAVQMPPGFAFASYEAVPGWDVEVEKRKAADPIESHGETIEEEIATITWTGSGSGQGIIAPEQFRDFGLSVGLPEKSGETLTFKAIQTYEDGEVVRWIGGPDSESPAAQVALTAAEEEHGHAGEDAAAGEEHGASAEEEPAERETAVQAASVAGDDGPSTGLVIAALAIGALGLAAGATALVTGRRRAG